MKRNPTVLKWLGSGILLLVTAAGPAGMTGAARATTAPVSGLENVVVIVLDALRADHLGCYGYHRNTSPNIDALAEQGVVFDRAIVPAGWTKPSVASCFTSLYPQIHGAVRNEACLPAEAVTLAEIFRDNGFFTFGFVKNVNLDPSFDFGRGFRVYQRMVSDQGICDNLWRALSGSYIDSSPPAEIVEKFRRFLRENPDLNLVKDGGFERPGPAGKWEEGWRQDEVFHSGRYAILLNADSLPGPNFYHLSREIELEDGEDFIFGAFVKTRDLRGEVCVELYEPASPRRKYTATDKLSGTNGWTLLAAKYRPRSRDSANAANVVIRPGRVADFQGGEIWVDDVFIIPVRRLASSLRPADRIFIYAHFLDPHGPYLPAPAYLNLFAGSDGESLVDKYDGEIREQDTRLGMLFEALESAGILEKSLIVITSDHGEEFGEHGGWGHGVKQWHEEVARVPLIFFCPKLFPEPERRGDPVESSVGLLPSLAELLGLRVDGRAAFQGRSFFAGEMIRPRTAFFYETPHQHDSWDPHTYVKAVTDGRWKYLTNQYRNRTGDFEIRGVWWEGKGVQLTAASPGGEESAVFASVGELESSEFFQSRGEEVRSALKSAYLAAEGRRAILFNLEEDPGETENLAARYPEKIERYQKLIDERFEGDALFLDRFGSVSGETAELGEDIRKELRGLGYLN